MKTKTVLLAAAIAAVCLTVLGCGSRQAPAPEAVKPIELHISAAVSLKDALSEIQKQYQAEHPRVKFVTNFGASGSLQRQIEQGGPADIFIAAAPRHMDELAARNYVVNSTRRNLVENKLVVITPKASKAPVTSFEDLSLPAVGSIAMGETAIVPAGQYAQQVLQHLGIWTSIREKAVFAKDARTVLAYTETGNVDAGIVYSTDAAASAKVRIAASAPAGSHQPILYPVAVLSGSRQQQAAVDFTEYLTGAASKAIFEKYGFVTGR